ncbi:MAG: triple tyrosine motif-containing protein, partial [Methanococcaceae archaeon]
ANTISDDKINALLLDKSSILWIGTANGGLNCLDLQTGKFKCFKNDPASQTSLSSNNVIAIHQDKFHEEILWIGTDLGFNKFDKTNGTCTHYTEEDGLSNNSINGLLTDNHGNLWVNTNNGITKYNPVTGKFTIYSVKEGLQGNEFNGKASYKDNNGYLYFGGMNGFSVFHPDSIRENFFKPPVVVTSFKILNKEARLSGQVSELNEINLTYKDYVISFEFAGLSFIRPEKNQYAYKLEGFDKNWIFSDAARRFATYTNLEPGEYTLRIKSSNNEGVWNEPGKNIKIIVAPPYWRTWWFKLLVLICFVAAVSFAVWYTQTRKLRKKIEKLQQRHAIEKERARISRNMHDELGGSLTKIHLLSRIITDEKLYTKEKAEKIYRFSNEVIQKLDEIVWTVNAKNDNLKNLVAYICEYMEEFFNDTGINSRYDLPQDIPAFRLSSEQRYNIFLAIKEGLNNIVKYSEATLIAFRLKVEKESFIIEIEDNGKGFDLEQISACGNGLKNMQERISKIGENIEIISREGLGTTIKIKVCTIECD